MKKLFSVDDAFHGYGPVLTAWQPGGNYLATAGSNGARVARLLKGAVAALMQGLLRRAGEYF